MACRIGITLYPRRREIEWRNRHRATFRDWEVLASFDCKKEALAFKNAEAHARGCIAQSGGHGPERATWYVYFFRYE